jgi:hypothetical protein
MKDELCAIWHSLPANLKERIDRCIYEALDLRFSKEPVTVFFRADKVGPPGKQFSRLMELFGRLRVPLSLAVVPVWLNAPRWEAISGLASELKSLWCWHQQGWRYRNNEPEGEEEQEFGPSRTTGQVIDDLEFGWKRLEELMGEDFYPIFTPPWNRCSLETLRLIDVLAYYAVSRKQGASPASPRKLLDFAVNVDLHTRMDKDAASGWEALFAEIKQNISIGYCGFQIHHQIMNDAAFEFLEALLLSLKKNKSISILNFKKMVDRLGLKI